MSPEEVRQHANRLAPLKAIRWTPWQALAWAVHRDEDRVIECSEKWRQMVPPCPVEGAPLGPFRRIWEEMHTDDEVREEWGKLWRALESGRVGSSGVDAANVRREITALAWVDLEFHMTSTVDKQGLRHPEADWPQCYREGAGPRERAAPAFREVLVLVADVLKEFPARSHSDGKSVDVSDRTGAPGRPSSMHLVLTEAERRRGDAETRAKVTDEALALFEWFKKNYPLVQAPTPKTIKNKISVGHRAWTAGARN
jgi:hypothetical protein